MGVVIQKNFFTSLDEVLEDVKQNGFWPTTLVSEPSAAVDLHWHDTDLNGYVIQGSTWVLDGETGERVDFGKGDKLTLPAGSLHAEGETTEQMIYIVALSEPRPWQEFLRMRAANDPARPDPRVRS
jgi:uncharacterized protein YjlB